MKTGFILAVLFAVLLIAAPWSSEKPDSLQAILGKEGGGSTPMKSLVGAAAAGAFIVALGWFVKGRKK